MEHPNGCYAATVAALSHMTGREIADQLKVRQEDPSEREYRSWCNSIPILVDVIHRAGLDELTLILEYQTPIGSRIDAVLLGEGRTTGKPLVLVIELKQWSAIEENTAGRESSVCICLSRAENRFEERLHPVQQTLTYAKHLRMNHSNVADGKMDVRCRQFLHNFEDKEQLFQGGYQAYEALRHETYTKGAEALLITYLTADQENLPRKEKRVCRNRTQGNRFVDYPYREDVLTQVLTPFWEQELYKAGLVHQKSLDGLRNSILFKYSPFTELSEEQSALIHEIEEDPRSVLIEGTAGTGKTVVLTNLAARLCKHHKWNVGVVVKANWVKTARSIFRAYGLGKNIEVGTAYQLIRQKKRFHILLVDEAHRLRWNSPKQNHLTTGIFDSNDPRKNELFLLGEMAERLVLFYDSIQAIRPSDIPYRDFQDYIQEKGMERRMLTRQFRVRIQDKNATYTADDYINGICSFLQIKQDAFDPCVFQNPSKDAYFGVVDSIHELFDYVDERRQYHPKAQCRVLAGYARPWGSRYQPGHKNYAEFDWVEDEEHRWKWNSTHENWIALPGSEDELGSIHAIQGVDLDYVGVVIAKDLACQNGRVSAVKEHYFDTNGTPPKESFSLAELSAYVRQIYYVLLTRGISGIRVYFEDPALKRHFMEVVGRA
jgi:hypothetical protein